MVLLLLLSSIICVCVFICTIVINVNNVLLSPSLSPAVNCESSLQSTCWTL